MKHISIVTSICLYLALAGTLSAQPVNDVTERNAMEVQQIGITDAALFDRLMVTIDGVGSNSRMVQEQQNLKPYMMPVRQLGVRGDDWSYALASCLEYYVNLRRNYKDNLSPDYINLSLRSQGRRPSIEEGLNFLTSNGTVSAAIVPYDAGEIPPAVFATYKYTINNYLHVFSGFATQREKVFEVRKALMRGNPVLVEFEADAGFPTQSAVRFWEPQRGETSRYTLIVVGYDETQEAFEVMSCWGSDWANNGYLWMRYSDFAQAASNGYVMVPNSY